MSVREGLPQAITSGRETLVSCERPLDLRELRLERTGARGRRTALVHGNAVSPSTNPSRSSPWERAGVTVSSTATSMVESTYVRVTGMIGVGALAVDGSQAVTSDIASRSWSRHTRRG